MIGSWATRGVVWFAALSLVSSSGLLAQGGSTGGGPAGGGSPAGHSSLEFLLLQGVCRGCAFGAVDLSGARLIFKEMPGSELTGANLSGANLRRTALNGSVLRNANLSGADLTLATLNRRISPPRISRTRT